MAIQTAVAIGANVRAEMARKRVRQQAVAEALGLTQSAVSARLSGSVGFRADEVAQLGELLGVPVARFYESGDSDPQPVASGSNPTEVAS